MKTNPSIHSVSILALVVLGACCKPREGAVESSPAASTARAAPSAPSTPAATRKDPARTARAAPSVSSAPATTRGKATHDGDPTKFPYGYYDVSGRGVRNDFCQVNRAQSALICDTGKKLVRWEAGTLDSGYEGTAQMSDVNGDGRDDYCRCVGDAPRVRFACLLATADGFAQDQYGFDPPGRNDCEKFNAAAAPAPQAQAAKPKPKTPACTPGNTSPCSCGAARGQMLCQSNGRFGACDCSRLAPPSGPCTFGAKRSCGCPGGIQGITVCNGKGWEPCAC